MNSATNNIEAISGSNSVTQAVPPNVIEVKSLSKNYGPHVAVDQISFSVRKGEVVGFLGPNGAGKTTTMKMISGFLAPSSGSSMVAGFDIFENPLEVKKRIGYLPETPPLYGEMSVENYLRFVAKIKKVDSDRVSSQVEMAIQKTDLGSVRKRMIQNLSKGYRQRVGISQAIVSDPEVLIMDEPTVGLDPRQVAEVRDLIKELAGQHTIILSTHILSEVQATCKRIIIINKGKIVAEDTLESLGRRMTGTSRVLMRVGKQDEALLRELRLIAGVIAVRFTAGQMVEIETNGDKSLAAQLAMKAVSSGVGLLEMREETFNLEDMFLKLTTSEETQGEGVTT
jgi:ABC-2 type transport system ATP-binding protein